MLFVAFFIAPHFLAILVAAPLLPPLCGACERRPRHRGD